MEEFPQGKNLAEQFDEGHNEYASFIETDPIRNFLHFPSVLKELGDVKERQLLDIGCGDGLFDRKLAEQGAHIVGYDISPNLIAKAKAKEKQMPQGVVYTVSDPIRFKSEMRFDGAVAVMVLPYAPDADYLKHFFASAHDSLTNGGKFVAVVFNPEFQDFNKVVANRFFRKASGNKVDFDFLDPKDKSVKFNAELSQFSTAEYETGAHKGGFPKIEWKPLVPNEEGSTNLGNEFWEKAIATQPYALIVAER